jgi:hypothetical protein
MFRKHLLTVMSVVIILSMLLVSCAKATQVATEAPQVQPTTAAPTKPPEPTATSVPPTPEPTPVPVRNGAWVDQVVFTSIDQADQAVAQLKSGDIDIYAYAVADPGVFKTVTEDANLTYSNSLGSYDELTFNPSGPEFKDGRLNPFSDAKIREAMNYAVDRNNIVQNIFGGLAKVKFLPLNSAFADYVRYVDVARAIEAKYAYNMDKAKEIVTAEMTTLGATMGSDGKWQYKGKPVVIIGIIRTEDARKQIGDYFATQLEALGFTVDRQYHTRSEASPLWNQANPADGKMSFYTGGWITTAISRDDGTNFGYFYTPLGSASPLWQAYKNAPEYTDVANKLYQNIFSSMAERDDLFRKAMTLAMEDSNRVWLIDQVSFSPYSSKVQVAYDLAGGISGAQLWPYTVRIKDQEGGTVKIAQPGIMVEPWNTVAGSNWIYDSMPKSATYDSSGEMADPYTGLTWPLRIEKADITVKTGLPVTKTLDWVSLNTADSIVPPDDAWVDWDATNQKWLTVADAKAAQATVKGYKDTLTTAVSAVDLTKFDVAAMTTLVTDLGKAAGVDAATAAATEDNVKAFGDKVKEIAALKTDDEKKAAIVDAAFSFVQGLDTTGTFELASYDFSSAQSKRVVTYPSDMWKTIKWQDGSPFTMGDFMMGMILNWDRAKPASPLYDEAYVPSYQSFMSVFKGFKIDSTDPLVIETYRDGYALDAENMVSDWWPNYGYGVSPWHTIALGNMAETDKLATFSTDKADALKATNEKIEWLSYIAGPSLDILKTELDKATKDNSIPYANVMGKYVTADEAKARYANLAAFYATHNHFWVGEGPFVLDKVYPTEQTLTLTRNPDYADPADRWGGFGAPMIAEVTVDGPGQVAVGTEAAFDVYATFNGEPYPTDKVDAVKWLLFDAKGDLVQTGAATAADGKYTVTLPADVTSKLDAGSNKIEVALTSKAVSIPTFASFEFVTTK